jgi:hypothetical protein
VLPPGADLKLFSNHGYLLDFDRPVPEVLKAVLAKAVVAHATAIRKRKCLIIGGYLVSWPSMVSTNFTMSGNAGSGILP